MTVRLSRLRRGEAIVTPQGDPTMQFQLLWQNALQVIEAQAAEIDSLKARVTALEP
jgi:hypothetical protein